MEQHDMEPGREAAPQGRVARADLKATTQAPGRVVGLARSRSRGRTPGELLARKQQLLSGDLGVGGSASSSSPTSPQLAGEPPAETPGAKLESLSAMLLRNQLQQQEEDSLIPEMSVQQQQQQQQQQPKQGLKSIDDVYILLAKKEKDLQLAAELGKVLLERNDELSKANERISEEYSHKLELLEQERHKLKRKLDLLDGEHENRMIELQTDCNILKSKLEQQTQSGRQAEREKSKLIDDLVQQNQRLTSELAEATKSEELLSSQLEQLNERLSGRLASASDRVVQVEALQEEIQLLSRRKQDLERRLKLAQNEKANVQGSLEETAERLLILESSLNERDLKIGELALEIGELRDSSSWLSAKLESMISLNERLAAGLAEEPPLGSGSSGGVDGRQLAQSSERERALLIEQLKDLRLKRNSRMRANELILADAAERRRRSLFAVAELRDSNQQDGSHRRARRGRRLLSASSEGAPTQADEEDEGNGSCGSSDLETSNDLICELFAIFSELHAHLLRRRHQLQSSPGGAGSASSAGAATGATGATQTTALRSASDDTVQAGADIGDSGIGAGLGGTGTPPGESGPALSCAGSAREARVELSQWRQLVADLRKLIDELPCSSCALMIAERQDYEQLQKLHARLCEDVRLKNEELLQSSAKTIEQEARLEALEERCSLLQGDLENCDKPREEIVRLAWKARDEAVARKNGAEIQLAKTRIENMQVSSQLMEVVQQKGELSQRLAQFEDDIHYMTQRSVNARFSWEEYAEEARRIRPTPGAWLGGAAAGSASAASSIQQLLGLSSLTLLSPKRQSRAQQASSGGAGGAPAPLNTATNAIGESESLVGSTATNLITNIKSSRFTLKFWHKPTPPARSLQEVQTKG